jgi:hypothetical protein
MALNLILLVETQCNLKNTLSRPAWNPVMSPPKIAPVLVHHLVVCFNSWSRQIPRIEISNTFQRDSILLRELSPQRIPFQIGATARAKVRRNQCSNCREWYPTWKHRWRRQQHRRQQKLVLREMGCSPWNSSPGNFEEITSENIFSTEKVRLGDEISIQKGRIIALIQMMMFWTKLITVSYWEDARRDWTQTNLD